MEEGRVSMRRFLLFPPEAGLLPWQQDAEFYYSKRHMQGSEWRPTGTSPDVTMAPAMSHFADPFLSKGCDEVLWQVIRALSPQAVSVGRV